MTSTIEPVTDSSVQFGLAELDLLGTYAGQRFPFPLRVPSFGRIKGERDAVLAVAADALRTRGLLAGQQPAGLAADLVTALREHRGAVDLVVVAAGTATGMVAMAYGNHAVVCRQSIDGEGTVGVARVTAAALVDEFTGLIPKVPAALAMPVTLPPGVVADAMRLLSNTSGAGAPRKRVRALVRERGGDEAAVDQLVKLLPTLEGRGQFGVVRRQRQRSVRPLEVSWLDGPKGRLRVNEDEHGWTSVNPLRHNELVRLLREAAALARR